VNHIFADQPAAMAGIIFPLEGTPEIGGRAHTHLGESQQLHPFGM
jgi:hypothetical protein